MRLIRFFLSSFLVFGIGIVLITTRPSESDFAQWYVEQNQTGLGGFFDNALIKIVEERTESRDYLVFSIFDLDGKDRYVGLLGHFFGRNTVEQTQETLQEILKQTEETLSHLSEDGT